VPDDQPVTQEQFKDLLLTLSHMTNLISTAVGLILAPTPHETLKCMTEGREITKCIDVIRNKYLGEIS